MLKIQEICKEQGITLQVLAKRLGVSYQALHSNMSGNPTLSKIKEIADALGVDITELFEQQEKVRLFAEYNGEKYEITHCDIIEIIKTKINK